MAKKMKVNPADYGDEVLRYYSRKYQCLASMRSTGDILTMKIGGNWEATKRIKRPKDSTAEDYAVMIILAAEKIKDQLKPWQINAVLPSLSSVKKWIMGTEDAKSPTGYTVEPDGVGPDGVPSWLVILGMI